MTYANCKDTLWVCENYPDRPWSGHLLACTCGQAGMPCPVWNEPAEGERPRMPADFVPRLNPDKGIIN
jgi:hypothetical protein